ncbi:MAG TPA: hypothetical protein VMJ34_08210 [Bryobacteraceae bacterium]|nr:hypothetical protein [Bryobacteraceae bacterium]
MSAHLSAQEISEWAAGMRPREREDHLHECAECRSELTRLQGALSEFRDSVRGWSAEQGSYPRPAWLTERPRVSHWLRWALVAAAMLALVAIPVYRSRLQPQRAETDIDDAVLMEQIDDGISRSVPATMEPLTGLVSWNSADASAPHAKSRQKKP